ncbi:MAG: class I SAM-dependent methyltransferase [Xenococcus sp. (in: cyanobacteria)]
MLAAYLIAKVENPQDRAALRSDRTCAKSPPNRRAYRSSTEFFISFSRVVSQLKTQKEISISARENAVSQEYNRLAPIYDRRWQNYINKSLSFLVNFADISTEASILELACGTGELTKLLLERNPQQQITGVDISESMLEIARNKLDAYPNVSLHHTSVTSLPFDNNSFDIVICANAFHYFPSPQLALAEIKRVLKPEGEVIILDWCRDYWVLKICDRIFKFIDPAYQRCYTQAELNRLLKNAGFNLVKDSKIRFGFIWELMAINAIAYLELN